MKDSRSRRGFVLLVLLATGASAYLLGGSFDERDPGDADAPHASAPGQSPAATKAWLSSMAGEVPPAYTLVPGWTASLGASHLAVADFNGDGRDDLAAFGSTGGFFSPQQLHLYLQLPNGSLSAPQVHSYPAELPFGTISGMVAGDLNEDGRPDLVLGSRSQPMLLLFLSQPGGGWDWNADGWADLFLADPPRLADMDGDGHLDVVLAGTMGGFLSQHPKPGVLLTAFGDGVGGFPRHGTEFMARAYPILALGQLDGAGRADALIASNSGYDRLPQVRRSTGDGTWWPGTSLVARGTEDVRGVAVADLTGDGRDDAVLVSNTSPSRIITYPQQANGVLASYPVLMAAGGYSQYLASTDLDGDGRADFLHLDEGSQEPRFFYYLQDAHGLRYPVAVPIDVAGNPQQFIAVALATGDLDGDGITDVVVATRSHGVHLLTGKLIPFNGNGGLPGPPTVLSAQADTEEYHTALVTVAAPADDGGNAITGFSVFPVPGGGIDLDAGSAAPVHRVAGLEYDRTYAFYARAHNAAGMGAASPTVGSVSLGEGDAPPKVTFERQGAYEGQAGDDIERVVATLSRPAPPGGVQFDVQTQDGTGVAGSDYVATQARLSVPEGLIHSNALEVRILDDDVVEPEEEFAIVSSNIVGGVLGWDGSVVVFDDDSSDPTLRIEAEPVAEGDAGLTQATVRVILSQPQSGPVGFDVGVSDNYSGKPGEDFLDVFLPDLVIPAGQTELQFQVSVVGDTDFERDEFAGLYLLDITGLAQEQANGFVHIVDDDPAPTLSVTDVSLVERDEEQQDARFVARLSGVTPDDVYFAAVTGGGTAAAGSDYVARFQGIGMHIAPGQREVEVLVAVLPDTRFEPDETFGLQLVNIAGVAAGDVSAQATLVNDDAPDSISVRDAGVGEGAATLSFLVELSEPQAQAVSFDVFTTPGTATSGADYTHVEVAGVSIAAGQTQAIVQVPILPDAEVEENETLVLNIRSVSGPVTLHDAQGLGRIVNDDLPALHIGDASVVEGNAGLTTLRFPVTLSSPGTVAVEYYATVTEGSAAWGDFHAPQPPGLIRIDAGRTTAYVTIPIVGDTQAEGDETFTITLEVDAGAVGGDLVAQGTIVNDDDPLPASAVPGRVRKATARARGRRAGDASR